MEDLYRLLQEGHHSLVVRHGNDVRTFDGRGIRDLLYLLATEPDFLQSADVADKIVGRAAAALMITGGVRRLFTPILSLTAIDLLKRSTVEYEYTETVPCIMNRENSGLCPMEAAALDAATAEDAVEKIKQKFQTLNHK